MEIFPADSVDVDQLLQQLHNAGLICRYIVDGKRFLQVLKFSKHQQPHHREPPSVIPECPDKTEESPGQAQGEAQPRSVPAALIPDILIPDILIPDSSRTPSSLTGSEISTKATSTDRDGAAPEKNERRRTKSKGTQLPDTFSPTEAHMELAAQLGVQISEELPAFLDFHASKGTVFKDWNRGFCTWLRNARKFNGGKNGRRHESTADRRAAYLAELCSPRTTAGTIDGTAERLD
ncbi:MAG: hypothetical protein IPM06_17925 [Rhizobiales bacterium]|nr:hypothetical protein [Hyphomicrobiales bacterium]